MKQIFKDQTSFSQESSDLADQFQKIRTTQKQKTREVTLVYSSCCGCGCSDVKVKRIVNSDSEYQNGDRISAMDLLVTDEII